MSRGRSFQGLSRGTRNELERDSIIRNVQPPCFSSACVQGSTAPPRMLREGSGTIRSGSISGRVPSPLHSWHIPSGLLKEKLCGASSGKLMPSTGQERCSLYMLCVSPPRGSCVSAWRTPLPSFSAVSTESMSRREPSSFFTTSRSTTTAMSCLRFLSRSMSSSRSRITPSTRARANPRLRASVRISLCSPLRCSISGASSVSFVPSGSLDSSSAICCALCLPTRRPQMVQCCLPTAAKSTRR